MFLYIKYGVSSVDGYLISKYPQFMGNLYTLENMMIYYTQDYLN